MAQKHLIFNILAVLLIVSCGNSGSQSKSATIAENITNTDTKNYLSMKVNGAEWIADNEVFGAYHPKGYNNAVIISGSKGIKDKEEQTFNLNLYNTNGPSTFDIKDGNADLNVVQLGNLAAENYLCGSMMGFDMKVIVIKASKNPDIIEATFQGKLTCSSGEILNITEGKFYYKE